MARSSSDDAGSNSGQLTRLFLSAPGVAAIVAVASLVVGSFGFRLARPQAETQLQSDSSEMLRFESRIWQDPTQFLGTDKLRDEKVRAQLPPAIASNWARLRKDFLPEENRTKTNAILFVINNHSPFPQGVETRLRNRVAVLAALRAAGLVKKGSDETRFVSLATAGEAVPTTAAASGVEDLKLVAYEVFWRDGSVESSSRLYERVLVFWLPERHVREHPWDTLQRLAGQVVTNMPGVAETNLQVGVLGPRTSDGLVAWFGTNEIAYARTNRSSDALRFFDTVKVISSSARVPDAFYDPTNDTGVVALGGRAAAAARLKNAFTNATVRQFGATDDRLCFALAAELSLRGVDIRQDKILLLSEYDTFYGRSLPLTFAAVIGTLRTDLQNPRPHEYPAALLNALTLTNGAYSSSYHDLLANFTTNVIALQKGDSNIAPNVVCFTYLAGLDGSRTVADNSKQKPGESKAGPVADEVTDLPLGEQQLDYTKRLAFSLNSSMVSALDTFSAGGSVKAVGLLGSDVFDKMLMLQALRSRLPDCIFFTTELDTRYNMPSQNAWTRNLVTASGFDLLPPPEVSSLGFAPFRDAYQTSTFVGCYSLLTGRSELPSEDLALYEIGRKVPHRLEWTRRDFFTTAGEWIEPLVSAVKNPSSEAWQKLGRRLASGLDSPALLVGGAIFFFFSLIMATTIPFKRRWAWHEFWMLLLLAVLCGVIVLVVLLIFRDGLEPMKVGDGVSVLPSAILLLMAVVVGLYGLIRLDGADGGEAVSRGAAFFLSVTAMFVLAVLVCSFVRCPMRSPNELLLRILFIGAWCVSGVLCVATAFFWRAFLQRVRLLRDEVDRLCGEDVAALLGPTVSGFVDNSAELAWKVEKFSPRAYFPMCTILLLVLAGSSWVDAWHSTVWLNLLLAIQVLLVLLFPLLLQYKAKEFKRILGHQLELHFLHAAGAAPEQAKVIEGQMAALDRLNRGCFAPLAQQPVLGALASLLGGSGLVTLLQQLFSR